MEYLIQDNITALLQGASLFRRLDPDSYCKPCERCFNSTVGGHVRHNIDHLYSLLKGYETGRVDYDVRLRDPAVETCPETAAEQISDLIGMLRALPEEALDCPLKVKMDSGTPLRDEEAAWSCSSVRRELQFLLSHTIHHYALIAIICRLEGIEPPPDFGVAPSTLRYKQEQSACAR